MSFLIRSYGLTVHGLFISREQGREESCLGAEQVTEDYRDLRYVMGDII